jgi:hypothetical protein
MIGFITPAAAEALKGKIITTTGIIRITRAAMPIGISHPGISGSFLLLHLPSCLWNSKFCSNHQKPHFFKDFENHQMVLPDSFV